MANTNAVDRKIARIQKSLDAIEAGRFSDLTIEYCCNYIAWIARYNKVPRKTWEPLCKQATNILDMLRVTCCWD